MLMCCGTGWPLFANVPLNPHSFTHLLVLVKIGKPLLLLLIMYIGEACAVEDDEMFIIS